MRHIALLAASLTFTLQAADPALLNLVMPDATVLAGINVQRAKTTPFGQFLLTQVPTDSGFDTFIAQTGFDPRQDLVEVLFASNAAAKKSGLVLARGTFSPAKIAAALASDSKHVAQTYNGVELITGTSAGDTGALAFLDGGIAIAGDAANVKAAIDRRGTGNAIDPGLAAKVASYAATDAWSVTNAPMAFGNNDSGQNNPIAGVAKTIQAASASVVLSTPVQISAEALASSDQDATSLSDVVRFVITMAQGNAQTTLLNSLNVTTDHSTVKLQLTIPEDQLENLLKSASPTGEKATKRRVAAHV